ncbi:TRAP transporter small permease [Pseudomonadota bacterium]|jgi:TRAP-type C4-dicarboxylate transport system permease small subunit
MDLLEKTVNKIDAVLRVVLAIMMALLVIDVTWQVLTRFILPQPSSFTEEVARFLLIWVSLLGGAYAYREHSHLGFDLFVRNLSKVKARLVFQLSCVLVAIFAISVLLIGGSNLVYLTWLLGQESPVLNIPMSAIYIVLPLSGLLFLIYSVYFFFDADKQLASRECLI